MADDLQSYKLQLQQVEAALITDPDNSELLKLKEDLVEVIELTRDLIKTQLEDQKKSSYIESTRANNNQQQQQQQHQQQQQSTHHSSSGSGSGNSGNGTATTKSTPTTTTTEFSTIDGYDEIEAALLAAELGTKRAQWKIGDKCQAKWTEDGNYYDATIEGISDSGEVNVIFDAYQNRSTTTLDDLKEQIARNDIFPSNKRHRPNNKEYLKKKKLKKQQRFKELEEERETDKNKWLNFSAKSTKKAGSTKIKSIFASPENVNGRVGIGTCGVSGNPMTKYSVGEKYRKGT